MANDFSLSDVFDSRATQVIDEVVLISSNMDSGSVNVPGGISQFDELVATMQYKTETTIKRGGYTLLRPQIKVGDTWQVSASDASTTIRINLVFTDENTITLSGAVTGGIAYLIGRKKRYATETMSTVINVNNGNPIGVNYRQKLPASVLPASMLDGAGNIKESVSVYVEVNYNGAQGGDAGWGNPHWIFREGTGSFGVRATILNGEFIVVQSGDSALSERSQNSGNAFGITSIPTGVTMQARIIVTNTERYAKMA